MVSQVRKKIPSQPFLVLSTPWRKKKTNPNPKPQKDPRTSCIDGPRKAQKKNNNIILGGGEQHNFRGGASGGAAAPALARASVVLKGSGAGGERCRSPTPRPGRRTAAVCFRLKRVEASRRVPECFKTNNL